MKLKRILLFTVLGIIAVLILLSLIAGFITDFWWFTSLDYQKVFWTFYETRYLMWLFGLIVFLAFILLNVRIAMRSAQSLQADPRIEKIVEALGKVLRVLIYGGSGFLALIMAGTLSAQWMEYLLMVNSESFGVVDPIFGRDIGFYVFTLPFLNSAVNWCLGAVVLVMIACVAVYLVRQGVSFAFGRLTATRQARRHIALLAGILFLLVAVRIWLGRFDVLYSMRSGSFFGAGFTDVNAQIPAAWIMAAVTLAAGALIAHALYAGLWKRLIRSIIAYVAAAFLVAIVYPGLIQKFVVNPNEQSKELEYIRNNIIYTRLAYQLDRIEEKEINPGRDILASDLARDSATINNIMLWDYRPLASTLDQLQVIRLYYDFPDVDIDRYTLPDGSYRQVMLSARELNQSKLPANARTWVNLNLVYTHGYGVAMSPVTVVTEEGLPEFYLSDIPPESPVGLDVKRPGFYFGEETRARVIVRGNIEEFDYPVGDQNKMTRYAEAAGVPIGSFFRKLLYAMHFGDLNILISGYIGPESRILYNRRIQERVSTIAPFLKFDEDPYLVVAEGRLHWICDAYTTTTMYPCSKPIRDVNYIRNSVKVVVDAYDGSAQFYVYDEKDPIISAYRRIFPSLFQNASEMPPSLRAHVRYPQDLFDMQSSIFETYHMEDPQVFYNKEELWNIAYEKLQENVQKMESYYVILRLPGEQREEFIQMIPYTPNRRDNMIAWLCARSDIANYGKMLVYKFPKQDLTYGPMQVSARIDQDAYISQQLTLWSQHGSSVTRGNLLVIPIRNDLLYVQPIYLQATTGKLPELKRIIVSYGNRIAMETKLEDGLARVFGGDEAPAPEIVAGNGAPETRAPAQSVAQLSRSAMESYDRAVRFQREGNWSKYGEELERLHKDLRKLVELSGGGR